MNFLHQGFRKSLSDRQTTKITSRHFADGRKSQSHIDYNVLYCK